MRCYLLFYWLVSFQKPNELEHQETAIFEWKYDQVDRKHSEQSPPPMLPAWWRLSTGYFEIDNEYLPWNIEGLGGLEILFIDWNRSLRLHFERMLHSAGHTHSSNSRRVQEFWCWGYEKRIMNLMGKTTAIVESYQFPYKCRCIERNAFFVLRQLDLLKLSIFYLYFCVSWIHLCDSSRLLSKFLWYWKFPQSRSLTQRIVSQPMHHDGILRPYWWSL